MESLDESISAKIYAVIATSKSFIVLLFLSIVSTMVAGFSFFSSLKSDESIVIQKHGNEELVVSEVTIDVSGEVGTPGVYTVSDGARLQQVIEKAGGFTDEADRDYIAQSFNLARRVKDGEKVYIPRAGDRGNQAGRVRGFSETRLININTADVRELDTLSSVGKVTAEKIISGRPYTSIDELVEKSVVTKKVFEKIQFSISTY